MTLRTLVDDPDLGRAAIHELEAIEKAIQFGLESTPREMMSVGGRAMLVAVVGVATPMVLGFGVGEAMRPEESRMLKAFLGAMLAATIVGITARVLKDAGALRTPFARIILGRMGMLVDVRSFASSAVLAFAALLTVAAIIGKLACAIAVPKGVSGLTVGLGMMPRGEVGLIFAGIGAGLVLDGRPVVDAGGRTRPRSSWSL